MELTVSPADLGTAFRKAKVDLYYSTNPSLFAIADYEKNLEDNLQRLQEKITGRSTTWLKDPDFLGTWTLAPKAFKCGKDKDADLIHASLVEEWSCGYRTEGQWLQAKSGNHDYCITGEIDALAQRQFQSCYRSPNEDFKLVPDGFAADMPKDRKVLPKGGE